MLFQMIQFLLVVLAGLAGMSSPVSARSIPRDAMKYDCYYFSTWDANNRAIFNTHYYLTLDSPLQRFKDNGGPGEIMNSLNHHNLFGTVDFLSFRNDFTVVRMLELDNTAVEKMPLVLSDALNMTPEPYCRVATWSPADNCHVEPIMYKPAGQHYVHKCTGTIPGFYVNPTSPVCESLKACGIEGTGRPIKRFEQHEHLNDIVSEMNVTATSFGQYMEVIGTAVDHPFNATREIEHADDALMDAIRNVTGQVTNVESPFVRVLLNTTASDVSMQHTTKVPNEIELITGGTLEPRDYKPITAPQNMIMDCYHYRQHDDTDEHVTITLGYVWKEFEKNSECDKLRHSFRRNSLFGHVTCMEYQPTMTKITGLVPWGSVGRVNRAVEKAYGVKCTCRKIEHDNPKEAQWCHKFDVRQGGNCNGKIPKLWEPED